MDQKSDIRSLTASICRSRFRSPAPSLHLARTLDQEGPVLTEGVAHVLVGTQVHRARCHQNLEKKADLTKSDARVVGQVIEVLMTAGAALARRGGLKRGKTSCRGSCRSKLTAIERFECQFPLTVDSVQSQPGRPSIVLRNISCFHPLCAETAKFCVPNSDVDQSWDSWVASPGDFLRGPTTGKQITAGRTPLRTKCRTPENGKLNMLLPPRRLERAATLKNDCYTPSKIVMRMDA
jgi:hypothetical protein